MGLLQKIGLGLIGLSTYMSASSQTQEQLNSIENMLSNYTYGQYSLLENKPKITFVDTTFINRTIIENYYSKGEASTKGNCAELANHLYDQIKDLEGFTTHIIVGEEPQFFYGNGKEGRAKKTATHVFLALTDKQYNTPEELIKANPYIVDPSFGILKQLEGSEYKINRIMEREGDPDGDVQISIGRLLPLGFDQNNLVLYKGNGLDHEIFLVNENNRVFDYASINDKKKVREIVTSQDIQNMIRTLRKAPFKHIDKKQKKQKFLSKN